MKKQRYTILPLLLASLCMAPLRAQFNESNHLFYHAIRTPQSNLLNPAFFPGKNTFYMMLPGVDMQFGMPLSINQLIRFDKTTQTSYIHVDSILNSLSKNNQFRFGTDVQVLGMGLKIKRLFLDANVRLRFGFNIGLPAQTINALLQGNVDDNGDIRKEVNFLNGDIFNTQAYLETSVGGGWHFDKLNLTIGAHVKLLSGIFNIQTDKTRITLESDENQDKLTARLYYELQGASCIPFDKEKKNFVFNGPSDILNGLFDNSGIAFDLGARYDLGPFSFSVAINDITAGIHWCKNLRSAVPQGGQGVVEFDGVNINTILENGTFSTDSLKDYFEQRLDDMMPTLVYDQGDYWFPVPTKLNLGASFSLAHLLRAGLLFHGQFDRGLLSKDNTLVDIGKAYSNTFRWNTTASVAVNLFNWLEVVAGSSIVYDGSKLDIFNPGAGFTLSMFGILQTYLMADYISSIRLVESKAFNVKFGLNVLIGKGGKKKVTDTFIPIEPILTPNEL